MHLRALEKINSKVFLTLSIPPTAVCLYLSKYPEEWIAVLTVYAATIVYLVMFSEAIYELTAPYQEEGYKSNKGKLAFLFIGKIVILISAIIFGVQIMGSRIIIPVLNYFVHIFVLGASLSMKKK
ncbi:hypothetical protein [Bacteriovorax sp. DB6_IX]|uniref:hypothetical protein n=1 Tax=Bacteriovorax sp. DB6_IX TaxID=1353530 RepID=UPI00055601EE|nr:hypothetical protein [Bacteriovorax sp. DB6_IX]